MAQIKNEIKYLEKNKIHTNSLKGQKEFINDKLMSKTRQRCKSKRYNIFIHEINKIQMMLKESNQLVP